MDKQKKTVDPPDGGYGWIIVVACVIITTCISPFPQCFGLIYEKPFKETNVSATTISFVLHLYNSIMSILAFVAGPLLKKWNFKQVALFGCFASCTGITLCVFASSVKFLIFSFCILQGLGLGFITQAASLAKNVYFKTRLTLAMSYSITGTGLLPVVMPQITNSLLNVYGIKNTILILAGVSYNAFIGALLLRPLNNVSVVKEFSVISQQQVSEVQSLTNAENKNSIFSKIYKLLDLELFKNRTFIILIVGMSISYVAELNFNLISPFILSELNHLNSSDVALAMSVQAAGDICGRLFMPMLSFRFKWSSKVMVVVTLICSCFARTVLVCFRDIRVIVISISVLIGLAKGGRAVYQSLVLPEYVNVETLPVATGFLMMLNGFLSLAIGPFIGMIHDFSGTYVYALHTASILSLSCALLLLTDIIITNILKKRSLNRETKNGIIQSNGCN